MKQIVGKNKYFFDFKIVLIVIITIITCVSGTAYAMNLIYAKNIEFESNNDAFSATNVNDAINFLYESRNKEMNFIEAKNNKYVNYTAITDSVTYTSTQSGNLIFIVTANVSGFYSLSSITVTSNNADSVITKLSSNNVATVTNGYSSYATTSIYKVNNVNVDDVITMKSSASQVASPSGANNCRMAYQVYSI